jgi:xylose isomerase
MEYVPKRSDRFSFGLWTVGHRGHDTFGEPVRPWLDPAETVERLSELGAYGVTFHDDDLARPGADAAERRESIARFRKALERTGLIIPMATTNLFWHPVFREGAFTANDRGVRRYAIRKTLANIDFAAELGAKTYVFWGGREGCETDAGKDIRAAFDRYQEAMNIVAGYVIDRKYGLRLALEPKPNEPRGDTFFPTVGHMLAFITTLDHSEIVGLNPEVAHEMMVGLNFHHAVAQALWHKKLFHIDLNAQRIGRFDQDMRFGSEDPKGALFLVDLLESSGYDGPRHFDARPYRTESDDGIWDFARGCMRTYLILRERAAALRADPAYCQAQAAAAVPELATPTLAAGESLEQLRSEPFDRDAQAQRGRGFERLDQIVIERLLGVH